MTFTEFITRNRINLSPDINKICTKGLDLMAHGNDPHHSINHINRMIANLDVFLRKSPEIKTEYINYSLLLPLIIWHDVWLSQQKQAVSFVTFIRNEIYHPLGASRMFTKFVSSSGMKIPQELKIAKTIRWNESVLAAFHWLRPLERVFYKVTIEGKIVRDLDLIDAWEKERFDELFDYYVIKQSFNPRYLIIGKFWYYVFIKNAKPNLLYFKWSKSKFTKLKKILVSEIEYRWNNRHEYGIS